MSSYEIRTYEPELHGQLLQFLGEHFPGTVKADPRYFQWKFADNPLGSSLDGYYLVLDGDTIVAQMATLKDRVEFEGQQLPFVWLVDLIVAPSHRGRGIAKRLGVEVGERHELIITNGSGDEATALWEGLKWRRVPDAALTTFTTVIHPSRAAPTTRPGVRRVLSLADRPAERYWRARTKRVPGVERLDGFGPEVDDLIASVGKALQPTMYRSAALYTWRFDRRPFGTTAALGWRVGGVLRGLAVVRFFEGPRGRWADIADVVMDPDDRVGVRALLSGAVAEALDRDCDLVKVSLSHPALKAQLPLPRWIRRGPTNPDLVRVHAHDKELEDRIIAAQWHMTGIISDRVDTGENETAPST